MSLEPTLFRRWRTPLIAFLWSVVTLLSVSAEDTATPSASSAPQANQAPGFSNQAPAVGLRQPESPDPSSVTSTSSGAAAPAPTDTASPDLAPPPKVDGLPPAAPATPSENVTINLIHLMVAKGLITKDDAANLIKQAEQEADTARAQAAATQATAERALTAQANQPAPAPAPAPSGDDEVRIAYVPDVVKNQIRDEVTQSVEKKARDEHWADKDTTPDWVKRFRVSGDIRVRYEGDFYPSGNDVGSFTNYNAINTGSGFISSVGVQQYNVDQDRNRFRLRARIGADIDLGAGFTSGMRVATGSDNSPVTENQTFGGANSAQGGNFGKYNIWLDRAFLKYEVGGRPDRDFSATIGRFDNPFFHTSMIWSDDVAFDGAVFQGKYKIAEGVTPFLTAGAFPVFNTDLNFSTFQGEKFGSEDKYLFATQAGTNWKINDDFSFKGAIAYYDFENIQGEASDILTVDPTSASTAAGSTDDSRPAFAQNGNTYIALRNWQVPGGNPSLEPQYFGLATAFHDLALTGQLDFNRFDPFHISLVGEVVKNLAFDRNSIINNGPSAFPGPVNNLRNSLDPSSFVGGDLGWNVRLNLGKVALEQLWDWNLSLTYRYVESDATVDGFTDSDFGGSLAGTNLQGYIIGGNVALSPRVSAGLKWMSADAIAGPIYKNDLIQFDINAKF